MVCLGNICRSPVAEALMRKYCLDAGLNVIVDSAGTSGHHSGEAPDKRSQKNALKNGIDISSLKSRKFTTSDFENFDIIFAMDKNNYRNVLQLARNEFETKKVKLFLNNDAEIPDPWHGGEEGFEKVFQMIKTRCIEISKILILEHKKTP